MVRSSLALAALLLTGCAWTSDIMEVDDGSYFVSARAAPIRGGSAGANSVAYEDAQKFCHGQGKRAVVMAQQERDVYQSAAAGGFGVNGSGGFGGVSAAAGSASLRFRCVAP